MTVPASARPDEPDPNDAGAKTQLPADVPASQSPVTMRVLVVTAIAVVVFTLFASFFGSWLANRSAGGVEIIYTPGTAGDAGTSNDATNPGHTVGDRVTIGKGAPDPRTCAAPDALYIDTATPVVYFCVNGAWIMRAVHA